MENIKHSQENIFRILQHFTTKLRIRQKTYSSTNVSRFSKSKLLPSLTSLSCNNYKTTTSLILLQLSHAICLQIELYTVFTGLQPFNPTLGSPGRRLKSIKTSCVPFYHNLTLKFVSISVKCQKSRRVFILPNNVQRCVTKDIDKAQRDQSTLHICGSKTNFIANLIFQTAFLLSNTKAYENCTRQL